MSYDPPEVLAAFARRNNIQFPLLSDKGSATIRRYGLLNTLADEALQAGDLSTNPALKGEFERLVAAGAPSARFQGVAIPGTFVLDARGRVTARYFEDYYRERRTVSNILVSSPFGMPVRGTKVSTPHFDMTMFATDEIVALGNRFSVVLDVTPKPGMHVYAPGAKGYNVIAMHVTPQPYVRVTPQPYPKSETYYFAPLKERVPVYMKPFRLVMDVVPEASPAAQAAFKGRDVLNITGSLDYQACDDKLCYNPTSIPVAFTVAIKPYVAGAPPTAPR